jgi:hypothetical protein
MMSVESPAPFRKDWSNYVDVNGNRLAQSNVGERLCEML